MSWFRIDDKSAFHRKVLKAGNEAWGAICRAGAVSAGEGTDGRVTRETLLDPEVSVELPGGTLQIRWAGPGQPVWMTGDAVTAFEGSTEL